MSTSSSALPAEVRAFENYAAEAIYDSDGDLLPKEAMLLFRLEGENRLVIRPSGTEPKIKFYLLQAHKPSEGSFPLEELPRIKKNLQHSLQERWVWLQEDLKERKKVIEKNKELSLLKKNKNY